MRRSILKLKTALERAGIRLTAEGELLFPADAPPALLLQAHRNRRALLAAVSRRQNAL